MCFADKWDFYQYIDTLKFLVVQLTIISQYVEDNMLISDNSLN